MDGHQVFVPMVGELFSITKMTYVTVRTEKEVFVPMVGELFSMRCLFSVSEHKTLKGFRPHGWGAFFNYAERGNICLSYGMTVFVPMVGELFSII